MPNDKTEGFSVTEQPKVDSEKAIEFNFWGHLSEQEQKRAAVFDIRKSELTEAFNKLFSDFGMKSPQKLISVDIWEDGRFKTFVEYHNWSEALK